MANVYFKKLKIILHSNYFLFLLCLLVIWITFIRNQIGLSTVYTSADHQITGVVKKIKKSDKYAVLEIMAKEKIQVLVYDSMSLKIGDTVFIEGKLKQPDQNRMKHLFNYRNYLKSQKIYWIMEAKNIQVLDHSHHWLERIKNCLNTYIETRKEQVYYKTFILGDQSGLTDVYKRRIRKLGVSHLFSLSGMHLSIFSLFLMRVLTYFKWSEKKKQIIVFCILTCYVLVTIMSPSILRAFFFLLLCTVNKIYQLKYTSLELFFYLCCAFLLINPFIIYSTSFLYSFIVSFFLLYFKKFIQKKHSMFRLSFVATIASLPLTLALSFELNLCSIFFNMILSPIMSVIIFPLSILSFIFPFLEPLFSLSLFSLEKIFIFMETYFSWMISFRALPMIGYILYFILIFICLESIQRNNKTYCYILFILFLFHHFLPYIDSKTKVVFLDVDQGDSSLISLSHHQGNILIDTGGSLDHKRCYNEIIPYLKGQGITSLNYLILTHGDYDHAGDAKCLIKNFKVKKVIFNQGDDTDLELELIHLLDKKHIKYYHTLDKLSIENYDLFFLNTKIYDNENDNSNVIYFNYHNYKFLFMGDAGVTKEVDILDQYNLSDITFLKVGHHGSNTSTSKDFIDSINPKYAIISVGMNNRYGHPKKEVLKNLSNSTIYRTDKDGSIEVFLNKNSYKINTCIP